MTSAVTNTPTMRPTATQPMMSSSPPPPFVAPATTAVAVGLGVLDFVGLGRGVLVALGDAGALLAATVALGAGVGAGVVVGDGVGVGDGDALAPDAGAHAREPSTPGAAAHTCRPAIHALPSSAARDSDTRTNG